MGEWAAAGRSYKGKGRRPSESVEWRRPRAPAEAPVKFLNVWFIYMCNSNDAGGGKE